MKYVKNYQCTLCEKTYTDFSLMTCPVCGEKGILEINYDYELMKEEVNLDYFNNNKDMSMLRYLPLMSIESSDYSTLKVGWTPLYKSSNISKKYSVENLYIKDEGVNPTASLKDRASLVACIKAIESNNDFISCSSTGNAASSLAGNAAKMNLKTVIFIPERAPEGKLSQLINYGANLVKVKGDYKDTFESSKVAIDQYGFYNRNAAINPHLVEGKKTVALEIAEQLHFTNIDNVIVSVGDGCTVYGVYKAFYDLFSIGMIKKIPKIIGVQSKGCSPFYDAWKNKEAIKEADENTIADSIAVGIPRNPVKGLKAIENSNGYFITVTDEEILNAMKELASNEGVFAEPAASASYAGFVKSIEENLIDTSETTVVIVTGNGLKDQVNALKNSKHTYHITKNDFKTKIKEQLPLEAFLDLIN